MKEHEVTVLDIPIFVLATPADVHPRTGVDVETAERELCGGELDFNELVGLGPDSIVGVLGVGEDRPRVWLVYHRGAHRGQCTTMRMARDMWHRAEFGA